MKIELKRISISERLSEETTAFAADLFVDGVKIGYAKNDGHGGSTDYSFYPDKDGGYTKNRAVLEAAEKYAESLPDIVFPMSEYDREPLVIKCNLEHLIDQLVEDSQKDKEKKKIAKMCLTQLVWGLPNGSQYAHVNYKRDLTTIPPAMLQAEVNKWKAQFKPGEVFFNINLEPLGIKL